MGDRSHSAACPGPAPIPKITNSHMIMAHRHARAYTHAHTARGDQMPPPTAPRWVNSGPFSPVPVTKVTASSLSAQVSSFWSSVLGAGPAWTICFCLSWTFNSWLVFVPFLNIATQGPIYSVNKGPRLTESHKMLFFIWVTDFTRKYAPSPEFCLEVTHCPHVANPTP